MCKHRLKAEKCASLPPDDVRWSQKGSPFDPVLALPAEERIELNLCNLIHTSKICYRFLVKREGVGGIQESYCI